jgi:hypothetical protein
MRRKIIEWIFKREDFDWLMTQDQRAEFLWWFVKRYFPEKHLARNRPKKLPLKVLASPPGLGGP